MTDNLFLFTNVIWVLTICLKVTNSNIIASRGHEKLFDENRDSFILPTALCMQVRNADCFIKEKMECFCLGCNSYYYGKRSECIEGDDIHQEEGCLKFVDRFSSERICNSSNLLDKKNKLTLEKPEGYELCWVVLEDREANTQFLDCAGKWRKVSKLSASATFNTTINPEGQAIIELKSGRPEDLDGKMIKVTVKCHNRTKPRHELFTCALLRTRGKMNCSYSYSHAKTSSAITTTKQPQTTATTTTLAHQSKRGIVIQYIGYGAALIFGIGFFVTLVLLIQKRKQLRKYEREKTHLAKKNIYGLPKNGVEDNEDYDDVISCQLPQSQETNLNQPDYEEVANANHYNKTLRQATQTNYAAFAYKNWQEIVKKMKTSQDQV